MKKVFFTAIALVAFSSASMANTIADEEVIVENKKEVKDVKEDKNSKVLLLSFCQRYSMWISSSVLAQTHNEVAAAQANAEAYFTCISSGLGI